MTQTREVAGRWSRMATQAPPRPKPSTALIATATSIAALLVLVAVGKATDETLLIPPLAASMALVAGASNLPLGQPRNVIGGQLVSAATGFIVLAVLGQNEWSAAIAGGLALGAMLMLRVPHSPAAATAVIVALTSPQVISFLILLAVATVILVLVGLVGNRFNKQRYPIYWW
jgi:CBS-domain-containing membrane protein